MKIILTGGSGFVGSHLVDKIIEEDFDLVVLDSISNHKTFPEVDGRSFIPQYYADLSEPSILQKIVNKDDWVIHLAAQSHVDVSFDKPHQTIMSNVLTTHNVLQACVDKKAEKVLIMSTDEVYGSTENIINENTLNPTNPYSSSKAAADMIVNSFKHMYPELHVNTLRSNNIAGPRQFIRNIIPRFSCLAILGKKLTLHGDGSAKRRYLWVEDAANALLGIIKKGKNGKIYHTSHPDAISNFELANLIGDYLNLEDFIEYVPDRVYNDTIYPIFDQKEIEIDTGWRITRNLEDFLPETINWYKENIDIFKEYFD